MFSRQLTPLYRPILKRAFNIVRDHRFLWFFGFFAALLGGSGEIDVLIGGAKNINWGVDFKNGLGQIFKNKGLVDFLGDLGLRLIQLPTAGYAVLAVFILGSVVLIWLFIGSQITLIDSTARIKAGEPTNSKIRHLTARKCFGKILGLNLINKVIIYGLLFGLGLPFLMTVGVEGNGLVILLIVSYIILVPLAIIVSFVVRYASCYVVLTQARFGTALGQGIKLFLDNWLISIEMAVLLFILNLLVGLLMSLASLIVVFPFMIATEILINIGLGGASWLVIMIGLVFVLGVLAFFGAIFVAFTYGSWTLLFLELNKKEKQLSRIVRWVAALGHW